MRHVWSLLAGLLVAPLTWFLLATGQYRAQATVDDWTLSLSGEGLAYISGAHWVLEGEVEMEGAVDADTSCTASGPWSATALGAPE